MLRSVIRRGGLYTPPKLDGISYNRRYVKLAPIGNLLRLKFYVIFFVIINHAVKIFDVLHKLPHIRQ